METGAAIIDIGTDAILRADIVSAIEAFRPATDLVIATSSADTTLNADLTGERAACAFAHRRPL